MGGGIVSRRRREIKLGASRSTAAAMRSMGLCNSSLGSGATEGWLRLGHWRLVAAQVHRSLTRGATAAASSLSANIQMAAAAGTEHCN